MEKLLTNVYVDSLNLYYGALKGTPYKWLDLDTFCAKLLPRHEINKIRYFTARVQSRPEDLTLVERQAIFLRALDTFERIHTHYGHFHSYPKKMRLLNPPKRGPKTAVVVNTEEKGSDVNLASRLLLDAVDGDCECMVIISNDSDLIFPVTILKERFSRKVGIVNPQVPSKRSRRLYEASDFFKQIWERTLKSSQLPNILSDEHGTIKKPSSW